jgi:peptidyl-Asp metalloendopeptidase
MRKHSRLALALVFCAAAAAQTIDLGRNHKRIRASRHGSAAIELELDGNAIGQGSEDLQLPLPDRDSPVQLRLRRFEGRDGANGFWRGSADLRDDSDVMLTMREGFVAGTVRIGTDLYEVRPSPDGHGHIVERIDSSTFPVCAGTLEPAAEAADGGGTQDDGIGGLLARRGGSFAAGVSGPLAADAVATIDLLTVYSPQARAAAGGAAQIRAIIQAAIDSANQAFVNSQVNAVYRLVGTAEAAHDDSGSMNTDLGWLVNDAATAALRNQLGADMVSLFVENGGGYCGLGYVMRSPGPGFAGAAFQVTARGCAVGNLSFAHENGHNLGMEHDIANGPAPTSASFPWSFGHLVNGAFRTVMSYGSACPNGCTRVGYFSNPNVAYLGYPTGVANAADNARTANSTVAIAAAFRSAPATAPPAAPSGLTAMAVSSSQINLGWADGSTTETGFKVERSADGVNFGLIATLGANVTGYSNTGLPASTLYTYRVRAYNGTGESANSNIASATTQALPAPSAPTALTATAAGTGQINLTWTDGSSNETGFKIERSSGGAAFAQIGTVGAGVTSLSNSGLTEGTAYSYRIRAYNASGDSAYSNIATATTATATPTAPATPGSFAGAPFFSGNGANRTLSSIRLTWRNVANETGYRVERCQASSLTATCTYALVRVLGANTVGISDGAVGATGKGIYKYRLRAENSAGASAWAETTVDAR